MKLQVPGAFGCSGHKQFIEQSGEPESASDRAKIVGFERDGFGRLREHRRR